MEKKAPVPMVKIACSAQIVFGIAAFCLHASSSFAAPLYWADRQGFHSVDQIIEVPLEHRRDLPMAQNGTSFPFTRQEDRDGAMYVWFVLSRARLDYPYISAKDVPVSKNFRKIDDPQAGDIAWWKGFVALCGDKKGKLITSAGEVSLTAAEKKRGKVTWYRYQWPRGAKSNAERAPQSAVLGGNNTLLHLDKAATFPPSFKDNSERDLFGKRWEKAVASLEELRKRYPDDPQVLRLLGVCYRLGYNLDMPGGWERAEAYLVRAQVLSPDEPDAFISLGILYADTGSDYAESAEKQFRRALKMARKDQLPQIWWGLALSLHYQGKTTEAVAAADRLIALHPEDRSAKKLRETILAEAKQGKEQ